MVTIKFCGISTPDDARAAIDAGCDMLGLNFYRDSPRYIQVKTAAEITHAVNNQVSVVAVIVDLPKQSINELIQDVNLDILQFHTNYLDNFCKEFKLPYLKSVPVAGRIDLERVRESNPGAWGFLLDTAVAGKHGGTGRSFDWELFPGGSGERLLLAGGLNPGNVAEAIDRTRPWGVDVASGVEVSTPRKAPALMRKFVSEVRRVSN